MGSGSTRYRQENTVLTEIDRYAGPHRVAANGNAHSSKTATAMVAASTVIAASRRHSVFASCPTALSYAGSTQETSVMLLTARIEKSQPDSKEKPGYYRPRSFLGGGEILESSAARNGGAALAISNLKEGWRSTERTEDFARFAD